MAEIDGVYRDSTGRALADYERPSVAVDTALLTVLPGDDSLSVLQVRNPAGDGTEPGSWRLPGTFLHTGERLIDAVLRSLREKAGVTGTHPRQLHVFDEPDRDDRGWVLSVAHVAVLRAGGWAARLDPAGTRFVPVPADDAELRAAFAEMPYGHGGIIARAAEAVRDAYARLPDPERLLGEPFTILDLRLLHEVVGGRPLQRDTFRRLMEPQLAGTGETTSGTRGRPAELFRHPGDGTRAGGA